MTLLMLSPFKHHFRYGPGVRILALESQGLGNGFVTTTGGQRMVEAVPSDLAPVPCRNHHRQMFDVAGRDHKLVGWQPQRERLSGQDDVDVQPTSRLSSRHRAFAANFLREYPIFAGWGRFLRGEAWENAKKLFSEAIGRGSADVTHCLDLSCVFDALVSGGKNRHKTDPEPNWNRPQSDMKPT